MTDRTTSSTNALRGPARADLDAWSRYTWRDGVQVDQLQPLDMLVVRTRNSTYEMTVLCPGTGQVLVRGGRFFPEFAHAYLAGCSLGGSFLKLRGIYAGFCLELYRDGPPLLTTSVQPGGAH